MDPGNKAEELIQEVKFNLTYCNSKLAKEIAINIQEKIIAKLSEYVIFSEYENEILKELKK